MDTTPLVVDFRKRPDCLDDLLCLVVTTCSYCTDCSLRYWDIVETIGESTSFSEEKKMDAQGQESNKGHQLLLPSLLIRALEKVVTEDDSLLPSFISFLSILALAPNPKAAAPNGAFAVHSLLSNMLVESKFFMDWSYVVSILKNYADYFSSPRIDRTVSSSSGSKSMDALRRSSSLSGAGDAVSSMAYFDYSTPKIDPQSTSQMETTVTPKKDATLFSSGSTLGYSDKGFMDDSMKFHIFSLLRLISYIALNCKGATIYLLQMSFPFWEGNNDVLSILFSLCKAHVPYDVRGQGLSTIADLVGCRKRHHLSREEETFIKSIGRRAWDLFEESNLIPVSVICENKSKGIRADSGLKVCPNDGSNK
jgi:hypothetical protein